MVRLMQLFLSIRQLSTCRSSWLCLAVMTVAVGCGGDSGELTKVTVYPVKGSVLQADGTPLNGGRVYFVPKNGALTSEGTIGTDGTFTLITGNSGEGAPAGEFKVRIEPSDPTLLATGKKGLDAGKRLPFATKYLDEDSSGLVATIKAEPNSLEPFRLK